MHLANQWQIGKISFNAADVSKLGILKTYILVQLPEELLARLNLDDWYLPPDNPFKLRLVQNQRK